MNSPNPQEPAIQMTATAFRRSWRVNFLRVQAGEKISIIHRGRIIGVMKSALGDDERRKCADSLRKLLESRKNP
jgi:hypothetical protein